MLICYAHPLGYLTLMDNLVGLGPRFAPEGYRLKTTLPHWSHRKILLDFLSSVQRAYSGPKFFVVIATLRMWI